MVSSVSNRDAQVYQTKLCSQSGSPALYEANLVHSQIAHLKCKIKGWKVAQSFYNWVGQLESFIWLLKIHLNICLNGAIRSKIICISMKPRGKKTVIFNTTRWCAAGYLHAPEHAGQWTLLLVPHGRLQGTGWHDRTPRPGPACALRLLLRSHCHQKFLCHFHVFQGLCNLGLINCYRSPSPHHNHLCHYY